VQDNSLVGIGAGLVAVVAAGYVCNLANFSQATTTSVMALALGVPSAIELQVKALHRDTKVDVARIQRGDLRRPVGLVVMVFAAAIVLLDSAGGVLIAGIIDGLTSLEKAGKIQLSTAKTVGSPLMSIICVFLGMCLFLVAFYASHYFAKRPYLWTAVAVGCALAIRELVVLGLRSARGMQDVIRATTGSLAGLLVAEVEISLSFLLICMVGAWLGRRYHDAFLAKKLASVEGKAARQIAKQAEPPSRTQTTATQASTQNSDAPEDSAAKLVTIVGRPSDVPSPAADHRATDHFKEIKKLAQLRDTGALTEAEFQAKKSEILSRI
jgi:Short C-terminal domain